MLCQSLAKPGYITQAPCPMKSSAGKTPGSSHAGRREPHWYPAARFPSPELTPSVRRWLLDQGSLTQRLIDQQRGHFSVQLLRQDWRVPLPSEQRLLHMLPRQRAIIREVILQQGPNEVVFARSVLPASSLEGKLAHLRRLGNKPLGAILFNTAGMQRNPFELALIDQRCTYLPPDIDLQGPVWGRRSRFEVYGQPLMVSEVFLQAFRPWPPTHGLQRAQRGAAIIRPTK